MKVLIVDDEEIMRVSVENALKDAGYEAVACGRAEEGLIRLEQEGFDVAVVDLKMPGMDGMEFLDAVRRDFPETVVVMMTAYGTIETAVEAMKKGAFDYLTKPFDTYELTLILERLQERRAILEENQRLQTALEERHGFHQLLGKSPAMQKVYEVLEVVCSCDCTALITGETGTGKEMVANAIHFNGLRSRGPLIKVSCAALSAQILESELFGHVRGAYTGAATDKKGRFELADGGTLFLDEIDDIPLDLQVKLLRVLEDGCFERVGSAETTSADVRIVAATKRDLRRCIREGTFRDDLFYRLNQVPIQLPPLRERREDIPLLIEHFLKDRESQFEFSDQVQRALADYGWPGNVRELKHFIERLSLFNLRGIEIADLPEEMLLSAVGSIDKEAADESFDEIMMSTEKSLLQNALERAEGNQREAARLLKMPASSLRSRLERHRLV